MQMPTLCSYSHLFIYLSFIYTGCLVESKISFTRKTCSRGSSHALISITNINYRYISYSLYEIKSTAFLHTWPKVKATSPQKWQKCTCSQTKYYTVLPSAIVKAIPTTIIQWVKQPWIELWLTQYRLAHLSADSMQRHSLLYKLGHIFLAFLKNI